MAREVMETAEMGMVLMLPMQLPILATALMAAGQQMVEQAEAELLLLNIQRRFARRPQQVPLLTQ
jgi:hypothetical protein